MDTLVAIPVLGAVILGIVEVAKEMGLNKRFIPVLALVLGVVGSLAMMYNNDVITAVIVGLITGLSAMGLFSGAKTTIGQ